MQFSSERKTVPSSTKWELGENVVLRLMECLISTVSFDIFMDDYSNLFVCSLTLELTTFVQQICSTKIGYTNAIPLETNSCKKRKAATLNSAHQAEKQCNFNSGWLERQQGGLHSFF